MRMVLDLAHLLLALEQAAGGGPGRVALHCSPENGQLATVWLDGPRICWVEPAPADSGLVDRLLERTRWSRQRLHELCRAAQDGRRNVFELLLETAPLEPEELSRLIGCHLVGALAALADSAHQPPARPGSWARSGPAPGCSRFHFSAPQLLAAALPRSSPTAARLGTPPAFFSTTLAAVGTALCYLETGDRTLPALPLVTAGLPELGLSGALRLYRAALRLASPPLADLQSIRPFAALARQADRGWLVARQPPYLFVFRLTAPGDYGLLLNTLRAARLPSEQERPSAGEAPLDLAPFNRPAATRVGHLP